MWAFTERSDFKGNSRKTNVEGGLPKGGLGQFADMTGGGVFKGGGVDTPMLTVIRGSVLIRGDTVINKWCESNLIFLRLSMSSNFRANILTRTHILVLFVWNGELTICYYHVKYEFQSESTLYSCLNVKELLV